MFTRQFSINMVCSSYVIYTDIVNVFLLLWNSYHTNTAKKLAPFSFFKAIKKLKEEYSISTYAYNNVSSRLTSVAFIIGNIYLEQF
jgi:hypothetical protein